MGFLRNLNDGLSQSLTGFFIGLFLAGGLVAGLYWFQEKEEDITGLPVIRELTDTYQEGLRTLGGLTNVAIREFYDANLLTEAHLKILHNLEGYSGLNEGRSGEVIMRSTWNREKILQKLQRKGVSRATIRQAHRYLDYIDQYKDLAVRDMYRHKVLASTKLAQALLESNAGDSKLARASNNHFGIKARPGSSARKKIAARQFFELGDEDFVFIPPAVGVYNFYDDNRYDRFEVYHSVGDSYQRHTQLLTRDCTPGHKGCYAWIWQAFPPAGEYDITEAALTFQRASHIAPEDFFDGQTVVAYYAACAAGLKMAGYATGRDYHKKIAYIIDTYELWRFDLDLLDALVAYAPEQQEDLPTPTNRIFHASPGRLLSNR